jgi:hypothetical protein
MTELKAITPSYIPAALQKAERYRLLNDSAAAESICLDILAVEPENQSALVMLVLSITDQFTSESAVSMLRAQAVLPRIKDTYKRTYYGGIICERRAKAQLDRSVPGAADIASGWYHQAMQYYEKAETMRPPGNDEAILRWNTCTRMLAKHEREGSGREEYEPALEE